MCKLMVLQTVGFSNLTETWDVRFVSKIELKIANN